jgi:hypothetical protein
VGIDVRMTGLLDMPLDEWLRDRVKEIDTSTLLRPLIVPNASTDGQLRYQLDNGYFQDYFDSETGPVRV